MEVPRIWRLKKQRYSLIGGACPTCDNKMIPPRDVCPRCGTDLRSDERRSTTESATKTSIGSELVNIGAAEMVIAR